MYRQLRRLDQQLCANGFRGQSQHRCCGHSEVGFVSGKTSLGWGGALRCGMYRPMRPFREREIVRMMSTQERSDARQVRPSTR